MLHDDLGREIRLNHKPTRIMALSPSMTEMLFALADTATIVGRTQNDNYPAGVMQKPVLNNYPMDYEQALRLKPDLFFTTEGITPLEVAQRLGDLGMPVYYQKYEKIEDIFTSMESIGRILGREVQAKHLADSLRQQVAIIRKRHITPKQPQRVLTITWKDPIYVYGRNTLLTDKLHLLGADNAVQEIFEQPYPALTREYILKLNPDVLLGDSPEVFEEKFFSLYPELRKIKAYQHKRLYDPTGNLIERPSPRVVESILELERFLYPR